MDDEKKPSDEPKEPPRLAQLINLTEGLKNLATLVGIVALLIGFWGAVYRLVLSLKEKFP